MGKAKGITSLNLLLISALLLSLSFSVGAKRALADPGIMTWSIINTPAENQTSNIIVSPSEINTIAIGADGTTFYCIDTADNKTYKSVDGGATWPQELSTYLTAAGANLPVWNIAVALDDVNFIVAITDNATPAGPKEVFVSSDGGTSWQKAVTGLDLAGKYISCVDISVPYGEGQRDIAIGTRDGGGTGNVWTLKVQAFASGWVNQGLPGGGDIMAIKFSPTYNGDNSLVAVSATAAGTFLNLGYHDVISNTTAWNVAIGYPVLVLNAAFPGTSPTSSQIITAHLEMPSDFSGADPGALRRCYVSTDTNNLAVQSGVYRVDNNQVYRITPNTNGRISSIAYYGTYAEGELLAGEVKTGDPALASVAIWRCSDPIDSTPAWKKSDEYKSPTGGGNSGYANAQVAWSPDGARAYCGTSSDNLSAGGTGGGLGQWPFALRTSVALDESAFSVSPYPSAYEYLLNRASKTKDTEVGNIWTQLSLIDTKMSFLSDVAALEVPTDSKDYGVLYLASSTNATRNFSSVWRSTSMSTSTPLGLSWERVLCAATSNNGTILRVNPGTPGLESRSNVIVFADGGTDNVCYSPDEGQTWQLLHPGAGTEVTDLTLSGDDVIYVLDNFSVRRASFNGTLWLWKGPVDTALGLGHTIATPLKNPKKENSEDLEDWVIVGDAGQGKVAYADFSEATPQFEPLPAERIAVPITGDMHVVADEKFDQNKIIYAASNDGTPSASGKNGKIYRWTIDTSTAWDELQPPNSAFYGLVQRNDVLYGAWNNNTAVPPSNTPGVDRTLELRRVVPPYPLWDDLTVGLPTPLPTPPGTVSFTREPSSLKIASNDNNDLWAIDNRNYDWTNKVGCLWAYTDAFAKVGPWSYEPPSDEQIPVDPVTGRASEVNFAWHQLDYAEAYELQIAKDDQFTLQILDSDNITPVDPTAPAFYFPAGGLSPTSASASAIAGWGNLESGHKYYWRVRASQAPTGEVVHSPWSATMFFTVEAGMPVEAKQIGLTLLSPKNGAKDLSQSPAFSWSPMSRITKYEFILAKDPALTNVIDKANVPTTAYLYNGKLDRNTTYYWQVRAIEPIPSDPSPVANFTVAPAKEAGVAPTQETHIPTWIWPVIIVCSILIISLIAYANTKPTFVRPRPTDSDDLESFTGGSGGPISALIMKIRRMRYRWTHRDHF